MSQEDRNFYHSFPRKLEEDNPEDVIRRGVGTLRGIKEIGLALAPEVVHWEQPLDNGEKRILKVRQCRISFLLCF